MQTIDWSLGLSILCQFFPWAECSDIWSCSSVDYVIMNSTKTLGPCSCLLWNYLCACGDSSVFAKWAATIKQFCFCCSHPRLHAAKDVKDGSRWLQGAFQHPHLLTCVFLTLIASFSRKQKILSSITSLPGVGPITLLLDSLCSLQLKWHLDGLMAEYMQSRLQGTILCICLINLLLLVASVMDVYVRVNILNLDHVLKCWNSAHGNNHAKLC